MKKGDKVKTKDGAGKLVARLMNGQWIVALKKKVNGGTVNVTLPESKIKAEMLDATFVMFDTSPVKTWEVYLHGVSHYVVNGMLLNRLTLDWRSLSANRRQEARISQEMFDGLVDKNKGEIVLKKYHCLFEPGKHNKPVMAHF